jgi:DNA segregation ATPase FtsK/SpoIIIE-like protein
MFSENFLKKSKIFFRFFLFFFSIFIFFSIFSYIFFYKKDQIILESIFKLSLSTSYNKIENPMGIVGGYFGYYLVYRCFGIYSIIISYIFFKISISKKFSFFFFKKIINLLFYLLFFTTLSGFLFLNIPFLKNSNISNLVGGIGIDFAKIIQNCFGLFSLFLFFFVFFIKIFFSLNIEEFHSFFKKIKKKDNKIFSEIENIKEKKLFQKDELIKTLNLKKNKKYIFPKIDFIKNIKEENFVDQQEIEFNKKKIIDTLKNFDVFTNKISATVGPNLTLYEIVPDFKTKVSKIKNLQEDIALSLAANGIRIIAPIPGKGSIGIEVSNKKNNPVSFRNILESEEFQKTNFDLPIVIGKSIENENFIFDLSKMPHLLIAGSTGQGKSVGLNIILCSLLYKKRPDQLKFIMIDPKKVELSVYEKLENSFLIKCSSCKDFIITNTNDAFDTLKFLCEEMDNRYDLLKKNYCRNIKEYNTKSENILEYIVVVIDEFADLMIVSGKEIENYILRLAQLARAVGIHLIIATQRPSMGIITGNIKANFPAKLSYKVSSKIDSRIILDTNGAEQLIGKGDLLFSIDSKILRLQAPFIEIDEIQNICDFITNQFS